MNIFKRLYARAFQKIMYLGAFFINFSEPKLFKGEKAINKTIELFKSKNISNIFIPVADSIYKLGLIDEYLKYLKENNICYTLYIDIKPNPTIEDVENGLKLYLDNNCQAIIAIGGGSVIDAAKIIGARASNPKISVNKMKGLFKIRKKLPLLIAVPTTAGTGSETTLAAVIVDKENDHKYHIDSPKLIPSYAVLDPNFLLTLPGKLTSTTGMDALTHAVEAYIGHSNTRKTKKYALSAIKLIFENLKNSYDNPSNINYRENMQLASYQAGVAFTRAYVGNVHSIAHALGGKYNVAHGYANAIILPIVLKEYGKTIYSKMAKIYDYVGFKGLKNKKDKCEFVINYIEQLNSSMSINNEFSNIIMDEDIDELSTFAFKESYPLYPVPKLLDKLDIKNIYKSLIKS